MVPIQSNAKSANAAVRADSIKLYVSLPPSPVSRDELLATLRGGKTGGPEHRAALYTMLAHSTPTDAADVLGLLPKESAESNAPALIRLAVPAARAALKADTPLDHKPWTAALASPKATVRSAVVETLGRIFWDLDAPTPAANTFSAALAPSLVALSSKTEPGSALETYVALVVLLGAGDVWKAQRPVLATVLGNSTKPGFLVLEKVYNKLGTAEEETWLLRAIQATVGAFSTELEKSAVLRQVACCACHSSLAHPRKQAVHWQRLALSCAEQPASRHPPRHTRCPSRHRHRIPRCRQHHSSRRSYPFPLSSLLSHKPPLHTTPLPRCTRRRRCR